METEETPLELERALRTIRTMSLTNATLQNENATAAEKMPPFLRLPVELRLRIYEYATEHEAWPRRDPNDLRKSRLATLVPQPRALLTADQTLIYAHPLAQANKQLRAEFSDFLRSASIPIATKVRSLDFQHIMRFLSSLEQNQQDAFKVRQDGTSGRTLYIELQGPYPTPCVERLQRWLEFVHRFVGPEKRAELACLYKVPGDDEHRPTLVSFPLIALALLICDLPPKYHALPVNVDIQKCRDVIASGGNCAELCKIMVVLYYFRLIREVWLYEPDHEEMLKVITGRRYVPLRPRDGWEI